MLKQLLLGLACLWSSAAFGQYYRDVVLLNEQQQPVKAATVLNRNSGEVYFSSADGRVRVFGYTNDTIEIRHVALAPRLLRWADLTPTLVLSEVVYSLPEVDVFYNDQPTYQALNRLLKKVRDTERKHRRNFVFSLETTHNDTLLEKTDGILRASTSSVTGTWGFQFLSGRYAFRAEAPFLNLNFTDFLCLFRPFVEGNLTPLRSPLNHSKIKKGNTRLTELPCVGCAPNTVLVQLKPRSSEDALTTLLFDTTRLVPLRVSFQLNQTRELFFKAISPEHTLRRVAFEITYYFNNDGDITAVNVQSDLDYDMGRVLYRGVQMNAYFWKTDLIAGLHAIEVGEVKRKNDVEKIAVVPFFPDLLERAQHERETRTSTLKYRQMVDNQVLGDNNITLAVLNAVEQSDVRVWQDTFQICPIEYVNYAPVIDDRERVLRANLPFAWFFLLDVNGYATEVRSAPTFVNTKYTYFTTKSQARALLYFNLLLDFCEMRRRALLDSLAPLIQPLEIEREIQAFYHSTVQEVEYWHQQTDNGKSLSGMRPLNELVRQQLGKDNFAALVDFADSEQFDASPYSYADLLALSGDFNGAVEQYNAALSDPAAPRALVLANRLECLLKLKRFDEACADYHTLLKMGQAVRQPERLAACKQE